MGRITVSLPDELEARLDEYARQSGQSVSSLVARAVAVLLDGGGQPPQPPDTARLEEARDYLAGLAGHVAQLRSSLVELGNWSPVRPPYGWQFPPPPPHPLPPWRGPAADEVHAEPEKGRGPV